MEEAHLLINDPAYLQMLERCGAVLEETAAGLQASYAADGEDFLPGAGPVNFPPRRTQDEMELLYQIFFPRHFNCHGLTLANGLFQLKQKLAHLEWYFYRGAQPYAAPGLCLCECMARVFRQLVAVRELLKKDVFAAYTGDPSCTSFTEVIRCFPGFGAILVQRVAHLLYRERIPVYPRELTELAHQRTGVDMHAGATVGEFFFIDHATGTVIGETAVLGDWVRLYQGVTIGALHFAKDPCTGMLQKSYKRHPTIGSNVVIGTGARVLGPITVGSNVNIAANCWVQDDVPDNTTVFIKEHPTQVHKANRSASSPPPYPSPESPQ